MDRTSQASFPLWLCKKGSRQVAGATKWALPRRLKVIVRKRNCASPRFRRALALLEWQNSVLLGRLLPADGSLGATVGEMLAQEHWEAMELMGRYAGGEPFVDSPAPRPAPPGQRAAGCRKPSQLRVEGASRDRRGGTRGGGVRTSITKRRRFSRCHHNIMGSMLLRHLHIVLLS